MNSYPVGPGTDSGLILKEQLKFGHDLEALRTEFIRPLAEAFAQGAEIEAGSEFTLTLPSQDNDWRYIEPAAGTPKDQNLRNQFALMCDAVSRRAALDFSCAPNQDVSAAEQTLATQYRTAARHVIATAAASWEQRLDVSLRERDWSNLPELFRHWMIRGEARFLFWGASYCLAMGILRYARSITYRAFGQIEAIA